MKEELKQNLDSEKRCNSIWKITTLKRIIYESICCDNDGLSEGDTNKIIDEMLERFDN